MVYVSKLVAASCFNLARCLPEHIHPLYAVIQLTANCNSRCVTCGLWKVRSRDSIDSERAALLLQELKAAGVKTVDFTDGETLLRKDFFKILGTLHPGDFNDVSLWTNGLLLDHYHAQINDAIISRIYVSVDGGPAHNDKIRGVKGYFEKAFGALTKLRGKQIVIMSTITNLFCDDVEFLASLCEQRGYQLRVNLPDTTLPFFTRVETQDAVASLWPNENEREKILDTLERHGILEGITLENAREYLTSGKLKVKRCILGHIVLYVAANGDMRPGCYVLPPAGNILIQDVASIVESQRYKYIARRMFNLDCPTCTCSCTTSLSYQYPMRRLRHILPRIAFLYRDARS
jgi:MoaA/NifB/PqqE/SkfB family radical SAM enzyme